LEKFREYKENKKPVRFIITRKTYNSNADFSTNMLVSIEDFEQKEKAGSLGQWDYSINLKEYKEYSSKKVTIKESPSTKTKTAVQAQSVRPTTKIPPKTYTVKSGDTLWSIAKKELNNEAKRIEIASINKISNPNKIYVGQILKLPALS
jgi:nucleoid-associated protein YgaU